MFFKVIVCIILCWCRSSCFADEAKLRIAGGQNAKIGDVPYVVRIIMLKRGKESGICTGSLIDNSWVMTAAHCVYKMTGFVIRAGIDQLEDDGQERRGFKWYIHERYVSGVEARHDIALINVDEPFELSETVKVISLSGVEWPQNQMYNRSCLAAGWGVTELTERGGVENLRKLNVTALHGEKACKCFKGYQNRRLVCLEGDQGGGVCSGDSGSALVCDDKAVGVASIIYIPESCSLFSFFRRKKLSCKTTASAYIYVCPYLSWIKKHVADVPDKPFSCGGSKILACTILFLFSIFYYLITN